MPRIAAQTFSDGVPGGSYTALQESDGSWTIFDVPVLSEMIPEERSNRFRIDADWMTAVIDRHRTRETEGHMAPVHINHHDGLKANRRIGFLRPMRVGQLRQNGKIVDVLFADFINVTKEDVDALGDLAYPYRSPEIHKSWRPEIQSLALMEDEAPHFKLPMLKIGERIATTVIDEMTAGPAVAFSERAESALLLFNFSGGAAMAHRKDPKKNEHLQDDDKKENGGDDKDENLQEGGELADVKKSLEGLVPLMESLQKLLQAMSGQPAAGEEQQVPAEQLAEDEKKKEEEKLSSSSSGDAALAGKVAALEERMKKRETSDKLSTLVSGEIEKLREDGWEPSESTVKAFHSLADGAKDPAVAVAEFAKSYRGNTLKDPENLDELSSGSGSVEDPEEVLKFSSDPSKLSRARELSKQFDELKGAGIQLSSSRAEFIQVNFEEVA